MASDLQNIFPGDKTVSIMKLKPIPDISFPMSLSRSAPFSLFSEYHNKMAGKLIEILMGKYVFKNIYPVHQPNGFVLCVI